MKMSNGPILFWQNTCASTDIWTLVQGIIYTEHPLQIFWVCMFWFYVAFQDGLGNIGRKYNLPDHIMTGIPHINIRQLEVCPTGI